MSSLSTLHLLETTARHYHQQRETFSRHEIVKKINEIKYLSAQRKVPRITLRKEIIHLEHRLQGIFELESSLLKQKRQESATIATLKKQIAALRQQVALSKDSTMTKKVEKLSQLLGEYTAQRKTKEEVGRATAIPKKNPVPQDREQRVQHLQNRLQLLKQELEIKQFSGDTFPELEQKIDLLEEKLKNYSSASASAFSSAPESGVEVVVEKNGGKHTLLFGDVLEDVSSKTKQEDLELEKELPLPPPPKMGKSR